MKPKLVNIYKFHLCPTLFALPVIKPGPLGTLPNDATHLAIQPPIRGNCQSIGDQRDFLGQLEDFLHEPAMDWSTDLLKWLAANSSRYPSVSQLAARLHTGSKCLSCLVLSCLFGFPTTSCPSEQVF